MAHRKAGGSGEGCSLTVIGPPYRTHQAMFPAKKSLTVGGSARYRITGYLFHLEVSVLG